MKLNNTMALAQIGPLMEDIKAHARAKTILLLGKDAHRMEYGDYIEFDTNSISYYFRYNDACHCHPETTWHDFSWSYEDFDFDIPD